MQTQLDFAYAHEEGRRDSVWLTQPMGGGAVRDLTWGEAMAEVRRMAAHLITLGLPRRSQIALFAKNNAWWFLADLAIWMSGHVSVPLYPTLAPDTIRRILEHSEARLVFVGKLDGFDEMRVGIPEGLPRIRMPLAPEMDAPTWADIVAATAPLTSSPRPDPDELATIIYTSGSTGVPKGVMHSFRSMCAALAFADVLGVGPEDRVLSYLPLAHAMERAAIETPAIKTAMRVYFAESLDTFLADLRRARPTLFISVPRLWGRFQQGVFAKMPPKRLARMLRIPVVRHFARRKVLTALGLESVRFAGSGSAPIPAELLTWYRSLGLELLEAYAMTENFAISHITRPGEVRVGYVGRPQDGVVQKLTPEGELLVKSPGNMLGYFKDEVLTAEVLDAEGYVHTGDRGELDAMGRFKITGRVKELFKTSKGKYVAPSPIENMLLVHEDLEQVLVSGAGMPQPFAIAVLSERAFSRARDEAALSELTRSLEELLERTNAALDPHEHLEKLVLVGDAWTIENGLLTPTMKVKRSAIETLYEGRTPGWYAAKPRIVWASAQ